MRAPRPHTPRQVRVTCTTANKFAVFIKIVWCRCVASAAIQLRKLGAAGEISPAGAAKPLCGENLIYPVRELRRNPLRSCTVPVGSRNFVPHPLAGEPPTGKEHEGFAPSNSAAGESHLHHGKTSLPYL